MTTDLHPLVMAEMERFIDTTLGASFDVYHGTLMGASQEERDEYVDDLARRTVRMGYDLPSGIDPAVMIQSPTVSRFKAHLFEVWDFEKITLNDLEALEAALQDGRVDGISYVGDCCCMRGVFAKSRGFIYDDMCADFGQQFHTFYKNRFQSEPDASSPEEKLFMFIRIGCTPENSTVAALVDYLIDQYIQERELTNA